MALVRCRAVCLRYCGACELFDQAFWCVTSSLNPGKLVRFPSRRVAAMGIGIERTFETVLDVETGAVAGLGHGDRRRARARPGTAEEIHRRALGMASLGEKLRQLGGEVRIDAAIR